MERGAVIAALGAADAVTATMRQMTVLLTTPDTRDERVRENGALTAMIERPTGRGGVPTMHLTLRSAAFLALLSITAGCGDTTPPPDQESATGEGTPTPVPEAQSVEAAAPDVSAIGPRWQWVGTVTPVERIDVDAPQRYTLRLTAEGRAEVQFDCNSGGGSYQIDGHQITFGPMMSTRMACPPDSQDAVYTEQLGRVTTFFIDDGVLYLEMPMDSGTMRFESASGGE